MLGQFALEVAHAMNGEVIVTGETIRRVFGLIQAAAMAQRPTPSLREMAEALNLSAHSAVGYSVSRLIEASILKREGDELVIVEVPEWADHSDTTAVTITARRDGMVIGNETLTVQPPAALEVVVGESSFKVLPPLPKKG